MDGYEHRKNIPDEIHTVLRSLYASETKTDTYIADWIITLWTERWSLEQRLGDYERILKKYLPNEDNQGE